jgi:hypothetical protein
MIWTAVLAVLLVSPAMAINWQNAKCCDAANCCEEVGCCDAQECCCPKTVNIEIGGWISSGIYQNQYGANDNGPLTMRNYADGYTLDQMWVYAEKKADNGGSGLAFGGRVDFMWGADGPDTQCFGDGGWDGGWMTSNDNNYGSALPQLYAEIAYNDLRVKVGHFYTIIGYEVVPAPDNFFYSHSYALAIEPFTHMGALAEYDVTDRLTIHGGWTNGWDNGWINPTNASTFLGGASVKLRNNMSLTYATSFGDLQENAGTTWTTYLQSLVFKWQVSRRLQYIMQSDFRTDSDEFTGNALKYYGINQYLLYKISNRWAAGARVEWFRDEARLGGQAGINTVNSTGITLGLNYTPRKNIIIRPEIRWDASGASPSNFAQHFDNNTRSSQFSGGFDCIFKF